MRSSLTCCAATAAVVVAESILTKAAATMAAQAAGKSPRLSCTTMMESTRWTATSTETTSKRMTYVALS